MSNTIGNHDGNGKLGKKISTFSRSYDLSCPSTCEHLENGCYADRIERRFSSAKKAYSGNLQIKDWQKIRAFLLEAKRKNNVVRFHVSGDYMMKTKDDRRVIDVKYINAVEQAYKSLIKDKIEPPLSFAFTHVYNKKVSKLKKYIKLYASVETSSDHKLAKKAGFKLFAWSSTLVKGKDKDKIYETEIGSNAITCFEQLGVKKSCDECKFCFSPTVQLDVAFMRH